MRRQPKFNSRKGNLPPRVRVGRPTPPPQPMTKRLPPRRAR